MRFLILMSVLLVSCSEPGDICKESILLLEKDGNKGKSCEPGQKMEITKLDGGVLQVTCSCPLKSIPSAGKIESRK